MIEHAYQLFGILIGILAIILSIFRFREGKMTLGMLSLWILVWIAVIVVSIFPESTNSLAVLTGIGRGLDFILILGLIGAYYLVFKMYNMIENMDQEITELVREIAIQREELKEKSDVINDKKENK
ncbi:MAG: DUF2304 family protein [Methanobacterium sp.]|uniref:DUF2304 domain-containing protein n=1 Tax=Methanobacterium sp. TaxID=2164 RepID=UPI003D658AB1|nr:DUF2304 family protein [Methanobacterium sp.]